MLRNGIRYECIAPEECSGHCCWGAGSVYIFPEDIARLLEFFNVDLETFLQEHVNAEEVPPIHVKYDGKIPQLMFKEIGEKDACHFQDEKGRCSIYQARPFQCIGYPFWRMNTKNKESWTRVLERCPGAKISISRSTARFYSPTEIKQLVNTEIELDIAWEKAMAEWKSDYKAYLRDYIEKRKKK